MTDFRKGSLSPFWLNALSNRMEQHFPDIIGDGELVDHWKVDGWNDGTTTLYGVYFHEIYVRCAFPDYGEPRCEGVTPRFEHTGWKGLDMEKSAEK